MLSLPEIQDVAQTFVTRWSTDLLASRKVVLYAGNPKAKILVIARDLGRDEITYGEPLIGKAGSLFRKDARRVGFIPTIDFLMTNTVPLQPKNNKAFPQNIRELFRPILNAVIDSVDPEFILTLGTEATAMFIPLKAGITKIAGEIHNEYLPMGFTIIPCAHPSYIARGVSKEEKWKTFTKPLKILYRLHNPP